MSLVRDYVGKGLLKVLMAVWLAFTGVDHQRQDQRRMLEISDKIAKITVTNQITDNEVTPSSCQPHLIYWTQLLEEECNMHIICYDGSTDVDLCTDRTKGKSECKDSDD